MASEEDISEFEENEDDEMILAVFSMLNLANTQENKPCYTSILTGVEWINELLGEHKDRCRTQLRMEPKLFQAFSNMFREKQLLQNTREVAVEEQFGMFMYMLSRNASYRTLQERFQHSGETIHRHINAGFNALTTLAYDFVKLPSIETHWKILSNPQFAPYFQNCIGAIDGTRVPVTINDSRAAPYTNRKGTLFQNMMVACDFDLNFVYISSGWKGSASDAGVLQSAIRSGFRVPRGKYYLVNAGYANTPSFLAPYRGVQYHIKEQGRSNSRPRDYKELFNLRHARLRNHIERAIGILKMRFPILKVATFYPMETQVKIPVVSVVLHNMIRSRNGDEQWLSPGQDLILESQFVDVPDGDDSYICDVELMNSQRNDGNTLRDRIALKMWDDYERNRRTRTRVE